jgi:putative flippase GtrA
MTTVTPERLGLIRRIAERLGGANAKELERFLKFMVVGGIGAIIDLTITNILLATAFKPTATDSTPALLAASCGFLTAVTSNFIWNRYWTYPESRTGNLPKQLIQFFLVNLVGLGIRGLIVKLFTIPFGDFIVHEARIFFPTLVAQWPADTPGRLGANMAVLLALVIVMLWNFFVNRRWTYKDVK